MKVKFVMFVLFAISLTSCDACYVGGGYSRLYYLRPDYRPYVRVYTPAPYYGKGYCHTSYNGDNGRKGHYGGEHYGHGRR